MKKALGLIAAAVITAGIAIPASAAPFGPCQGSVDTQCTYGSPPNQRVCDYWVNEPAIGVRNFCGELPGIGPIV